MTKCSQCESKIEKCRNLRHSLRCEKPVVETGINSAIKLAPPDYIRRRAARHGTAARVMSDVLMCNYYDVVASGRYERWMTEEPSIIHAGRSLGVESAARRCRVRPVVLRCIANACRSLPATGRKRSDSVH